MSRPEATPELAQELGLDWIDPQDEWVDPELVRRLSRQFVERHNILPLHENEAGELVVAMADPQDTSLRRELESSMGRRVRPVLASAEAISKAIYRSYDLAPVAQDLLRGVRPRARGRLGRDSLDLDPKAVQARLRGGGVAPYVELYNFLLVNAIERRASDIHLEPEAGRLRVRFRIDGLLREALELPDWAAPPLTSRIKVVAEMDLADSRRPQDGKASATLGSRRIDLRISTMPSQNGEKVVIRLLDPSMTRTDLGRLGWQSESLRAYYHLVSQPQGLVLTVGPTGSGKSTTLYSTIHRLNSENSAIVTIEDPVEYEVSGITQVQVNQKAGVTFASAIRAVLRQDPNVLVIGEIRDAETAKAAAQAANTGHLVLSTLHTIDAISAVQRLLDLDVPGYMLSSTLSGIVAQRLVRRVCPHCSVVESVAPEEWERLRLPALNLGDKVRRAGAGCPACQFVGYRGRLGIFELAHASRELRGLLADGADVPELWAQARADGMVTLFEDALLKVRMGLTTLEEVIRVVPVDRRVDPEDYQGFRPEPAPPEPSAPEVWTAPAEPFSEAAARSQGGRSLSDTGPAPRRGARPAPEVSAAPKAATSSVESAELVAKSPFAEAPTTAASPAGGPAASSATPAEPEPAEPAAPLEPAMPAEPPELLIVDDAEEILMMVEMAFEDDYRVRTARDGVEALERIAERRPDLVVLDVMMPRMSGHEVCKRLKESPDTADLPVIMLSARGETSHVKQGFYAGADDYLPKPFDPEVLMLRVRALLRRSGRLR